MKTVGNSIKVTTEMTLPAEFLHDIITTACEGGINYWARAKNVVRDDDLNVTRLEVQDREEHTEYGWHIVNKDVVAKGIERILEGQFQISDEIKRDIFIGCANRDAGYIDANGADCIVQAGIFNEIVYS